MRFIEPPKYWEWVARTDMQVSPWFNDWECSLVRAGWVSVRKLSLDEAEDLGNEEMDPSVPHDADLFCPSRNVFLTLLPSKFPILNCLENMRYGFPGSLVIIRSRPQEEHFSTYRGLFKAENLLTGKYAERCAQMGAFVEDHGMLYEWDGWAVEGEISNWKHTRDQIALEVFHEYRSNSVYYHLDQERLDERLTKWEKNMAKEAERFERRPKWKSIR